ncbi:MULTISPECIES: YktB family protein [Aneurinibacillus]|uniref:UPF0637 protein ADA01nite_02500 n=1 Tax=Aneurinibacillus danicus TaxID=267746 RepID=A0A511V1M3_9BACL|nr:MULTISPECIES: DUF1054 domain-containing protein [Aneurinibacillus]GEN32790.1 UPF0637 protein [Aneurinibacillus danicus]
MNFDGFTQEDFAIFTIEGLDARMAAIRERIQPKFRAIGEELKNDIALSLGNEMFLHIAKHARRTVNPPKDSWLAISHNKRGYKAHPHFQVGLFDDHVFIWLAFIYELPYKKEIAQKFIDNIDSVKALIPKDFVISLDHTKKEAVAVSDVSSKEFEGMLDRFRNVKKAEFLVGRHIKAGDPILKDGNEFLHSAKSTIETLLPLYRLSLT